MRVVYMIDSLAPGGAERSLADLAPHVSSRGVRLDVVYLHERAGLRDSFEKAGISVFHLADHGRRIGWARQATRLVRSIAPDLVHTTLFEADIAGRIAGAIARVPVVSSLVNTTYGPGHLSDPSLAPWKIRAAQALDIATARAVTRFHAITREVADVMARRLLVSRTRVDVIPRGRDEERLGRRTPDRRARAREQLGIGTDVPLVLAAARQAYQKGLDVLLDAFAQAQRRRPEMRLVIAGREGDSSAGLRRTIERLGITGTVRLLGARSDVPELMCAADVFVLPSRWEGLGSVLLEAMALEAPVVASDLPAVREVLSNGSTARLVPAERPEALAEGIMSTLEDREAAAAQASRARARFLECFTIDRVAESMVAFWERASAGPSARSRPATEETAGRTRW